MEGRKTSIKSYHRARVSLGSNHEVWGKWSECIHGREQILRSRFTSRKLFRASTHTSSVFGPSGMLSAPRGKNALSLSRERMRLLLCATSVTWLARHRVLAIGTGHNPSFPICAGSPCAGAPSMSESSSKCGVYAVHRCKPRTSPKNS